MGGWSGRFRPAGCIATSDRAPGRVAAELAGLVLSSTMLWPSHYPSASPVTASTPSVHHEQQPPPMQTNSGAGPQPASSHAGATTLANARSGNPRVPPGSRAHPRLRSAPPARPSCRRRRMLTKSTCAGQGLHPTATTPPSPLRFRLRIARNFSAPRLLRGPALLIIRIKPTVSDRLPTW